ncbi:MAG: tetratricopeptide repeat protein [Saprospiraceae bacterium]
MTSSHRLTTRPTWTSIEADVREGMALDPENKYLPSNLAPALLFQGKKDAALAEYKKWMDKPFGVQDYPTYREAFLDDLNTFEKAGIPLLGRQMWRRCGSCCLASDEVRNRNILTG